MNWLKEMEIEAIEWPPQSPDLNPIENVWSILKQKLYDIKDIINSLEDLKKYIKVMFFND